LNWQNLPVVAFDTETTGLMALEGDRMIEFAAVVLTFDDTGSLASREDFSWLINPGVPIPRRSTEITGITDADVADAPTFDQVAEKIFQLLDGAVTIAHNYSFDRGFLSAEFERSELYWPNPIAEIDTLELSKRCFPEARTHKLSDLARRTDVILEGAHRATNDAAACGLAFGNLAKKASLEDDLQHLLDWSGGIGRTPVTSPFTLNECNQPIFTDGEYKDSPVVEHPIHLAWMLHAKRKTTHGWTFSFDDATRAWVRRFLDVRCSGGMTANAKSVRAQDWGLTSCISPATRSDR
jgi:DNA polymerase III epsilon subunit family exonuclease